MYNGDIRKDSYNPASEWNGAFLTETEGPGNQTAQQPLQMDDNNEAASREANRAIGQKVLSASHSQQEDSAEDLQNAGSAARGEDNAENNANELTAGNSNNREVSVPISHGEENGNSQSTESGRLDVPHDGSQPEEEENQYSY